jgi:hypothetical protein
MWMRSGRRDDCGEQEHYKPQWGTIGELDDKGLVTRYLVNVRH